MDPEIELIYVYKNNIIICSDFPSSEVRKAVVENLRMNYHITDNGVSLPLEDPEEAIDKVILDFNFNPYDSFGIILGKEKLIGYDNILCLDVENLNPKEAIERVRKWLSS